MRSSCRADIITITAKTPSATTPVIARACALDLRAPHSNIEVLLCNVCAGVLRFTDDTLSPSELYVPFAIAMAEASNTYRAYFWRESYWKSL
jgi:hypothetical protein